MLDTHPTVVLAVCSVVNQQLGHRPCEGCFRCSEREFQLYIIKRVVALTWIIADLPWVDDCIVIAIDFNNEVFQICEHELGNIFIDAEEWVSSVEVTVDGDCVVPKFDRVEVERANINRPLRKPILICVHVKRFNLAANVI